MSKKSPLQSAIGAIEASKPIALPRTQRTQTFAPPSVTDTRRGEVDPWNSQATPSSVFLPEQRTPQSERGENERKSSDLEDEVPDNRDTEIRHADYQVPAIQDTQSQEAENRVTENEDTDLQKPESQDFKNRTEETTPSSEESRVFARPTRATNLRKKSEHQRKPKNKPLVLSRKNATKDQIASFINPRHSRAQRFMQLAEEDTLELLLSKDLLRALKGNDWPVFLFMSLKAYEWDPQHQKRRDGKRNFATEFVARGAGISESTAFEVINRLIAKGYVKPIEANARGNIYHVSPLLFYRPGAEDTKKQKDTRSDNHRNQGDDLRKPEDTASRNSEGNHRTSEDQGPDNQDASPPIIGEPESRESVTRIDRVHFLDRLDILNLSLIENHFEKIYFSEIRAPQVIEDEKRAFRAIVGRNGDITLEEFLECFEMVKKTTDGKGNAVVKKFVWMAGGFDKILRSARASLGEKRRKAENSNLPFESPVENPEEPTSGILTQDSGLQVRAGESNRKALPQVHREIQNRIDSLTQKVLHLETKYSVSLDTADFADLKAVYAQREDLCISNADLLDFNRGDFWESEVKRLDALVGSIALLHRDFPALVSSTSKRIDSTKSEVLSKLQNWKKERDLIRMQIAQSLGARPAPVIQLTVG